MIRLFIFFALLVALAFGIDWLVAQQGFVTVTLQGVEYRVTLVTAAWALLAVFIVLMIVWGLLRFALRLPSLIALSNRLRRRARGYGAVSRGLVAVGTGDRRGAFRFSREAERLLAGREGEALMLLLKAQAAQLNGDGAAAESAFKAMLSSEETRNLGLRGLFIEASRKGNSVEARAFAGEAYRALPGAAWAGAAMLGFHAQERHWRDALDVVEQNASRRLIDRATARRQRAVLLAAAAQDLLSRAPDEAQAQALEALRLAPDLVPAAVVAGHRLSAKGDYGKAAKVIEAAYKSCPHPDLWEAYLAIRPGDSALDRLKRAKALMRLVPGARETRFAIARAALDAREFTEAREMLDALVLEKPTMRACRAMAELEQAETGNLAAVRGWLARASRAPRDPAWVADGFVSDLWSPLSPVTGEIDAFRWMVPPESSSLDMAALLAVDPFEAMPAPALPPAHAGQEAPSQPTPGAATPRGAGAEQPAVVHASAVQDATVQKSGALVQPAVHGGSAPVHEVAAAVAPPDDPGPRKGM